MSDANSKPAQERHVPAEQVDLQAPERHIKMDSVRNLRDLGGYQTHAGRLLAWGKVYRSAGLHEASAQDIAFLRDRLAIRNIVDLRNSTETEIEPEPESLKESMQYHWISILVEGTARDDIAARLLRDHPESQNFAALLVEVNQKLALDHIDDFKKWFQILLNEDPPFLFHCTEGKDRTGFAGALLLAALDVDMKTIIADYLLTNKVNANTIEERIEGALIMSKFQLKREPLRQLLMVREDYLQAAFNAIESNYGSVKTYLAEAIGLTEKDFKLLEDKFLLPV